MPLAGDGTGVRSFTMAEVERLAHSQRRKCVVVIHGDVVDIPQSFLLEHPGGFAIINDENGKDVTVLFEDIGHSTDARRCVESFKIGHVVDDSSAGTGRGAAAAAEGSSPALSVVQRAAKAKALADKSGVDRLSVAMSSAVFVTILLLLWLS